MVRLRNSLIPAIVGLAVAVGSCGLEESTAPSADRGSSPRSLRVTAPAPTVVYGPATFTRDTGKPRTDSASFSAHAGDTLTFVLTSGAVQGLNATLDVNGVRLFSSTGGRGLPDTIRTLARATNTLRVWMAGKPGSSLRIVATVPPPAETRVLSVMYESSVVSDGPSGDTALALGSRVHYEFTPHAGFRRLRVVVDGQLAPDSGTITMDRAHWIAASADTVIALDPTEQALAQELRNVLDSTDPVEAWRAYEGAVDQAATTWGDEGRIHFARIRRAIIDPVADVPALARVDSALAGMNSPVDHAASSASLRDETRQSPARGVRARDAIEGPPPGREATQIFLVNGISASMESFGRSLRLLDSLLQLDTDRFPQATTTIAHLYNPSFFQQSSRTRYTSSCTQSAIDEEDVRRQSVIATNAAVLRYVSCMVRAGLHSNDISEMLRWARDASNGNPQIDFEVNFLARLLRSYQRDSLRHVFVIAHSEGSLLTQLAVRRMIDVLGVSDTQSPQCLGTVSLAGVGTANWPLPDRHSRFVVAKHDLVTQLFGDLRNTRATTEDADTRALDARLALYPTSVPGDPVDARSSAVAREYAEITGGVRIHRLNRYLSSPVMWPIITNDLDEMYRTCAVGAVTVAPAAATLQLGGAASFGATWKAVDGQPLATSDSVQWSVDPAFASVSPSGRLVAGSNTGAVALLAKVRNTIGSAAITMLDDSVQALYEPPVVTVTERTSTVGPHPPGPTTCEAQHMTITASAMPGASITSVELYVRWTISPDSTIYERYAEPLDTEFTWRSTSCTIGGVPAPWTYWDNWYRLVVTDSHGLFTEKFGPNP